MISPSVAFALRAMSAQERDSILVGIRAFLVVAEVALEEARDGGELVMRPTIEEAHSMLAACTTYLSAVERELGAAPPPGSTGPAGLRLLPPSDLKGYPLR